QVPIAGEFQQKLELYERLIEEEHRPPARISRSESYRRFLSLVIARLRRAGTGGKWAYGSADELESDLELVRRSWAQNRGQRLAELLLDPLIRKVRTFGFHLTTLDLREHAAVHRAQLAEIKGENSLSPAPDSLPSESSVADGFRDRGLFHELAEWKK